MGCIGNGNPGKGIGKGAGPVGGMIISGGSGTSLGNSPVCMRMCCCSTRALVNCLWQTGH